MGQVVLWGCGGGFRKILEIFPSFPDYVNVFVDQKPCQINDISIQSHEVLSSMDVELLIICSYNFEESIRRDAMTKYHIASNKMIPLNQWLIKQIKTEKSFLLRPTQVAIDAATLCQLDCRDCYMRRNNNGTMGHGYLKLENFRQVLERHHFIKHIELANSGEVFLNPDLQSIIRAAAENDVSLSMGNGTNFNDVSDNVLEEMVRTQAVKTITVAIDGASQHTYEIYRRKGDFDRVLSNIRKLNVLKKKYHSEFPVLKWSYIIFSHTEDDVELAKKMAKELDMDIFFTLAWEVEKGWTPNNPEKLRELTGLDIFTREEYSSQKKENYMINVCRQMFFTPYFNWDGRLLGCCWVFSSDWSSNLFDADLVDMVNSGLYREALCMILGGDVIKDDLNIPCALCSMRNEYLRGNFVQLF